MRPTAAITAVLATLLVTSATAWAFTPSHPDDYKGSTTPGSHTVLFSVSVFGGELAAFRFSRDSHQLIAQTPVRHDSATGVWSFHTHDAHWRVKGHWVTADEVHGSICDLVKSPGGCPDGEHLQTYVAHSRSSIKRG